MIRSAGDAACFVWIGVFHVCIIWETDLRLRAGESIAILLTRTVVILLAAVPLCKRENSKLMGAGVCSCRCLLEWFWGLCRFDLPTHRALLFHSFPDKVRHPPLLC